MENELINNQRFVFFRRKSIDPRVNNSRQQLPAAVICNALPLLVGAQLMQTSRSAPAQARELPSQPQGMLVALSFAGDVLVTSKYVLGPKIKMCLFVCFYLTYVPVAPNGIVT